jgi:uncharacterized protein YuzE
MKIKYFKTTDTLFIEFREADIVETRDLDEDTVIDLDADGNMVSMTMEHASNRSDAPNLSFEEIAA